VGSNPTPGAIIKCVTQKQIASAVGVTEVKIRNRHKDLRRILGSKYDFKI